MNNNDKDNDNKVTCPIGEICISDDLNISIRPKKKFIKKKKCLKNQKDLLLVNRYSDDDVKNLWIPSFERLGTYVDVAKELNKIYGKGETNRLGPDTVSDRIRKMFSEHSEYFCEKSYQEWFDKHKKNMSEIMSSERLIFNQNKSVSYNIFRIRWINKYLVKFNYVGDNCKLILSLLKAYLISSEDIRRAYSDVQNIETCSELIGIVSAQVRRHLRGDLKRHKFDSLINKMIPAISVWDFDGLAENLIYNYGIKYYPSGFTLNGIEVKLIGSFNINTQSPFYNLYLDVCKKIIQKYSSSLVPKSLIKYFGRDLELNNDDLFPISIYKISRFLGFGIGTFHSRFNSISAGSEWCTKFESLLRMEKILTKTFNKKISQQIIFKYLSKFSNARVVFYKIARIFYFYTKKFFGIDELSQIIFHISRDNGIFHYILGSSLKQFNVLWYVEYHLSKLKPNPKFGFIVKLDVLKEIRKKCIRIIRHHIKNNKQIINERGFILIWETLYVLSEIYGRPYKIEELSDEIAPIHHFDPRSFLRRNIFRYKFNFNNYIAKSILRVVGSLIPREHRLIQWIKLYLKTRGLDSIDFELLYYEITRKISYNDVLEKTSLSKIQKNWALTIVWGLTCGRSWLSGKKISFSNSLLHHIRHNDLGKTLYGGFYDTLLNFACLEGDKENSAVEGNDFRKWEERFIKIWEFIRTGNPKLYPSFWEECSKEEFLNERKSKKYLDFWLEKISKNKKSN